MKWSFALWLIGLIFLWLEFYLPGGVLGGASLFSLLAALGAFCKSTDFSPSSLVLATAFLAISVAIVSYIALKTLRRGAKIETKSEQGHLAATYASELVGQSAIALTDLCPTGYIRLAGNRSAAISQDGFLVKGTEVIVLGGEGFSLLVTAKKIQ